MAPAIREYRAFLESLHKAHHGHYLGQPHARVAHEEAFAEMRDHLVKVHGGVKPVHSFVDANGAVFDCIPIETQVSLRGSKGRVPKAPALPKRKKTSKHAPPTLGHAPVQLHTKLHDPHGNRMAAPAGTIPVRRHSIEDLARYRTLHDYLAKRSPLKKKSRRAGAPLAPSSTAAAAAATDFTHWYAYGGQKIANAGGGSTLNVWDPAIGAGQNMSLSQLWITDAGRKQTVEVGWQVNPRRFNSTRPVLFVYWTADDYDTTGCYNLTCNGFVQTSGKWALGGALPSSSTPGGAQVELAISVMLDHDKWWIYVDGEGSEHALGYFPTSLYGEGPLARGAGQFLCGGEVTGTTSAPPMGSGQFANAGYQHATYQRDIHTFSSSGARRDADLALTQPSKSCFTAKTATTAAPWGTTLWFGGPGGKGCPGGKK
jgi:hypothetical protein